MPKTETHNHPRGFACNVYDDYECIDRPPKGLYLFFNAVEEEKPDFIFFSDKEAYNQVVDLYLKTREKRDAK